MKRFYKLFALIAIFASGACSFKADEIREKNRVINKQLEICEDIKDPELRVHCVTSVGNGSTFYVDQLNR